MPENPVILAQHFFFITFFLAIQGLRSGGDQGPGPCHGGGGREAQTDAIRGQHLGLRFALCIQVIGQ